MRRAALPRQARGGAPASLVTLTVTLGLVLTAMGLGTAPPARADHTATPSGVTIAGSLQSELGCPGDWQPECSITGLGDDPSSEIWRAAFEVPAGAWQYKAALNGGWEENYGAGAQPGGENIGLELGAATSVRFYYDHRSHWATDSVNSVIATLPGSFQSELGCPGDWQPHCLRSWLQDPDGDGTYTFETSGLPAGSYEVKVAIDESWTENYGAGGVRDGVNITFHVPFSGTPVVFSYDAATHLLDITTASTPSADGNVEWDGLRHDSRDTLYRTPGGAVPAGTPVTIRFRTFHGDVTNVKLRVYSLDAGGQQVIDMVPAATNVDCYEEGLDEHACDFWSATLPNVDPDNLWYRFIVSDGPDTDYYADDTPALDGGLGSTTDEAVDRSYALMVHVPGFEAPAWASDAVIYQIFPDRFRNGRANNDPQTGDVRYDDPVIALPWGTKPEGYCRNYADGDTNCPWRFDDTPPDDSPGKEQPRGRDYMGGDLKGVEQQLDYLAELGVTAIYFNPIFDAGSNHSYDTQDYTRIDPSFGTQKDWENLVAGAGARGIRVILDGVFNHMSSDSPFFDRYGHHPELGACESVDSPWRDWFLFRPQAGGPCAGPDGGGTMAYDSWFGFDSIPVIDKTNPDVQAYFLTDDDAIARRWLEGGASGWRLDVSGDPSFPDGYWETFREVVKETDPDALTISETWQKDSTLLREIRGDRLDTTMNYRLRDAVLGLLAPQAFDSKGFADSGYQISPTQFANRIASVREDYPDAAYYSLMNLLDSHDTERLLWTLTPGIETTAGREGNTANVAAGKARMRIASLIQFTMPGAPTVFYGDEVGMTGDDDPDDRRTYPWPGRSRGGDVRDHELLAHYQALSAARAANPALTDGDIRMLLADDGAGTVAYGRRADAQAALVAINRSDEPRELVIPVAGYLPDGIAFSAAHAANAPVSGSGSGGAVVTDGAVTLSLPPLSARLLVTGEVDLAPPSAPVGLAVTGESDGSVALSWPTVPDAASYEVYVSPLPGGGYVPVGDGPVTGTDHTVTGLENARTYHFVVRAVDAAGNRSEPSNEVSGVPHMVIGWANLRWPPAMDHVISTTDRTDAAYGQVWIDGATSAAGATPSLRAQLGFGPAGFAPASAEWIWVEAAFNVDAGNNDEFAASLLPESVGTFDYLFRYSTTGGRDWVYADRDGLISPDAPAPNPGALTVNASDDETPPEAPSGLQVVSASPAGIQLNWDAVAGDASLHGYEIGRSDASGGPYAIVGNVFEATFTDTTVAENVTYHYVVRAVDTSFNRSGWSEEVSATAQLRTVSVTFNVTVPESTDATERSVHIAGFLDRLDGDLPQWDPGGVVMTRVDATHWTITLTGSETTQIEYKYVLGAWDYVEKDAACGEIGNRQLTLAYGEDGIQVVNDTVDNWRNVPPCGN